MIPMLKRKLRALIVMLCVPLLAVFAGVRASAAAGFTDVPSNAGTLRRCGIW